MVRLLRFGVVLESVLAAAMVSAAVNLNSSKSNVYRLTYHADLLTGEQAEAMLAALDKLGPLGEKKLKMWLAANFKRFGVKPEAVKKTLVLPPGKAGSGTAIILLSNPDDEARALAATVKSSKSNSSD